jgi:hypothetical protein
VNPLAIYTVFMVVYVIFMAALWAEPKIKHNNKEKYRA